MSCSLLVNPLQILAHFSYFTNEETEAQREVEEFAQSHEACMQLGMDAPGSQEGLLGCGAWSFKLANQLKLAVEGSVLNFTSLLTMGCETRLRSRMW